MFSEGKKHRLSAGGIDAKVSPSHIPFIGSGIATEINFALSYRNWRELCLGRLTSEGFVQVGVILHSAYIGLQYKIIGLLLISQVASAQPFIAHTGVLLRKKIKYCQRFFLFAYVQSCLYEPEAGFSHKKDAR